MTNIVLSEDQFNQLINNKVPKKITINELNKTRKNSINIETFIEKFEFQEISKIMSSDIIEYVVSSIIQNLNKYEDEEICIICSNAQTKQFFYKTDKEWIKGVEFMEKLYRIIYHNGIGQVINNFYNSINDDNINNEKQRILTKLCDCDLNPLHKIIDKSLLKLGRHLKAKD
jgi:preprotein translocase subunit SecA